MPGWSEAGEQESSRRVPTKASEALRRVDIPLRGRRKMRRMGGEKEWIMGSGKIGEGTQGWKELSLSKTLWLEALERPEGGRDSTEPWPMRL